MIDANTVPTLHLAWLGYLLGFEIVVCLICYIVANKIGELSGLAAAFWTFVGCNVVGGVYLLFRFVVPRFIHLSW